MERETSDSLLLKRGDDLYAALIHRYGKVLPERLLDSGETRKLKRAAKKLGIASLPGISMPDLARLAVESEGLLYAEGYLEYERGVSVGPVAVLYAYRHVIDITRPWGQVLASPRIFQVVPLPNWITYAFPGLGVTPLLTLCRSAAVLQVPLENLAHQVFADGL